MRSRVLILFTSLVVACLVAVVVGWLVLVRGQHETVGEVATGCSEVGMVFPLTLPSPTAQPAARMEDRALIRFMGSDWIVVEEWNEPTDDDDWGTRVTIDSGGRKAAYVVGRLIEGGQGLRLLEAQTLCDGRGGELLILGFQAGFTGAVQGFMVVRRHGRVLMVQGLPLVYQGKLSVSRRTPDRLELWSAERLEGLCGACEKPYTVRRCQLTPDSVQCGPAGPRTEPMIPAAFIFNMIEIRQ